MTTDRTKLAAFERNLSNDELDTLVLDFGYGSSDAKNIDELTRATEIVELATMTVEELMELFLGFPQVGEEWGFGGEEVMH